MPYYNVSFTECNDSDVRLVQFEGDMENEGRIEYCSSGRWGLVCSDFWDNNDAMVICRQLGYNVEGKLTFLVDLCSLHIQHTGQSAVATDTSIGRPTPTVLTKVDCVGSEESISQCPQDNSHVCLNPGAGVICLIQINGICYTSFSAMSRFNITII